MTEMTKLNRGGAFIEQDYVLGCDREREQFALILLPIYLTCNIQEDHNL